jgi:hypothetical protein
MSTTGKNCSRRANDGELSMGDNELTRLAVLPFRSRVSDKGISDVLLESADLVGEFEEPATVERLYPAGGEVLLW